MKKRLLNQGFTLPEILVASLITIILLGAVGSVFLTSMNLFSRGAAISKKSGSITNVETNLQNKLAVATQVTISSSPTGPYNIGFDDKGGCEEVIGGTAYPIDQMSEIILTSEGNILKYELVPRNAMAVLEGGIVVNNKSSLGIDNALNQEKPQYLVIE